MSTMQAASSGFDELKAHLRGKMLLPTDQPQYDEARKVWNGMIDKHPACIVRCAGVADVISSIKFAKDHSLFVAIRGGGHNVAGNAVCDGGLVIDLSAMKGIRVDPQKKTVRAEPGVVWRELDHETQQFGLALTGGLVSTTGIAGFTLGGGVGWLVRKLGLTLDNLISADVVTADGKLVIASENENSDLFWGIRGGGGNFGVVTSFEYRLHPVGPIVLAGLLLYGEAKAKDVIENYRRFLASAPDELTTIIVYLTAPPAPFIPPSLQGKHVVAVALCYAGDIGEGERVLKPLRAFGSPDADLIQPMPYTVLQTFLDASAPAGMQNYWKSSYLSNLSGEAIDAFIAHCAKIPSPVSHADIHHLGGAYRRVHADDETAFAQRQAEFILNIVSMWGDPRENDAEIKWTRDFFEAMKPYSTGGAYVNFMDRGDESRIKSAYGNNYARLVALKKKYDPTNLFRFNQNIDPSAK